MRYAVLLRGINVGGSKKVPMAGLRALLGDLGCADVSTHLQSGNAVVTSALPAADLERDVAAAVAGVLQVTCSVLVRTAAEMAAVIGGNPLGREPDNPSRYFVAFLSAEPDPALSAVFAGQSVAPDELWLRGREAYLWCPAGAAESKLSAAVLEKKLAVRATARNWNTVTRLANALTG